MDRLRAMSVFLAVANAGSLSAAARALGEPLTNVSRRLSQLESHLGVTLVERTTRRLVLTSQGRKYLQTCRRVLDEVDSADSAIAGLSNALSGDISITAPVGLGRMHVLPVVTAFLAVHHGIDVRLQLVDRVVDMMTEGIDVAIRVGKMRDSPLRASNIGSLRVLTCASPHYLERRGTPNTIAALADHDCVTFAELPNGSRWTFNSKRYGRQVARVRSRLNVNTADAAVAAAAAGVGIVRVLSYQAQAAIDAGLIAPVLQRFDDVAIPISLASRPAGLENTRMREFVRFATPQLRLRLANN